MSEQTSTRREERRRDLDPPFPVRAEGFRWFVRGVGFAVGLALVYALATTAGLAGRVLFLVFIAVLLASGLEPFIGWLRVRLPLGRGATILLVYAAFFVLVIAFAILVVPAAFNQFEDLTAKLPPFLDRAREAASTIEVRALRTVALALIGAFGRALALEPPRQGEVVEVSFTVAEAVISVVTLLAIVYFWLTEHARLQRYALAFVPAERRAGVRAAWNEVEERLGSWVRGQLVLMGTIGIATSIAYWLLGLESPILLGLIAAIAEAVPIVGPLIGAVPALLVASTAGPERVAAVAFVVVVLHVVEGNVLVPYVMRNTIGISPFLVLTSLLVGGAVAGIQGAVVAVPLAAAAEVILERMQAREEPVAQDPAAAPDAEEREAQSGSLAQSARRALRR